jgi:membrane-bound ClpP family serine protease
MPFIDKFVQLFLNLPLIAINFAWNIINPILIQNWVTIIVIIFVLLNIATLKFLLTNKWGALGSLFYNIFYFGIMYLVINNCGPEIILEDYFKTISFVVYVAGFFLTRFILNKLNIKNMSRFHY